MRKYDEAKSVLKKVVETGIEYHLGDLEIV